MNLIRGFESNLLLLEVKEELWIVVSECGREVLELQTHGGPVKRKVIVQSTHEGAEANVGSRLVLHGDQQR
jgi:hypothetical protein